MPVKIVKSKVKSLLLFTFTFLLLPFLCYAAPCYGTKMPNKKELFLGLQNYTVFKRYLKDNYGKFKSVQDFFLLSYGIFDWLTIDLKGGCGNMRQHPVGSDEVDYPTYLGGGYGFRLKVYDAHKLKTVFGFQHISIHPKTVSLGAAKHKAVLDDWQFSLLVSRVFGKITPYIGTKWSNANYLHWIDGDRKLEKSDLTKSVGLLLGFDLPITEKIWLNLEGQFFDGEALAVSVNYSF